MSFDKPTRNKLASMVGDCRRLLTEDIRHQLQAVYGLQPDGTALPVSNLSHLDERGREVASGLRLWQEHLASTEAGTEPQKRKAAFDRLAHETAFTLLNRLAALRMCEERGHVIECVRRGLESDGFALYERFSEGVLGGRGETYRIFLERMFAELSVDLGALFELDAPQSLVFPRERCLEQVLSLLNRADLAHLWKEDETIGWIYQYFNSKEEREAMREASAAPRNSRELAVRNQFFTPRYVVEFLVDNTLGRIWYDMRQGQTGLKGTCHYLVRRPSEIFLSQGQQTPLSADAREDLSQDELVKQPVYIPYRAKRDPRTIKILDPAVGSGHFLLYSFDLLEAIYQEAWEETDQPIFEATSKTIRDEYKDLSALRVALPELILRHNLHGIDIDLRACQIAALALWLRAQHAYHRLGLKTSQRPKIERSNIVCAEPMPGGQELLDQFLADLQPKVIGQLVQAVFEKMKLAGEAGSLLKIEEEIANAVADAKQKWLTGPKPEQGLLFADLARPQQKTLDFDFSDITNETFWEKAEERIYATLQNYAEQAENGRGYRRRLFANDTASGFAFIDLCRKRYDVTLMNPPFGEPSTASKEKIFTMYPVSKYDLAATFMSSAALRLTAGGRIGALASRSIFFGQMLAEWRRATFVQGGALDSFADLGIGVLDSALVEACACVLEAQSSAHPCVFMNPRENEEVIPAWVADLAHGTRGPGVYTGSLRRFDCIPDFPFAYWTPDKWLLAYKSLLPLSNYGVVVKQGMESSDNFRFVRLWWEIPSDCATWRPYSKGGWFGPQWKDMDVVVNWGRDGEEVKAYSGSIYGTWTKQITNTDYYGRIGITYPASRVEFSPRVLPKDCIVGCKGPIITLEDEYLGSEANYFELLGVLSSSPFRALLNLTTTSGDTALRKSYREVAVAGTPIPPPAALDEVIGRLTQEIIENLRNFESTHEICRGFVCHPRDDARQLIADVIRDRRKSLDEAVSGYYGFMGPQYLSIDKTGYDDLQGQLEVVWSERISVLVGYVFGRWDVRFATSDKAKPALSDPFGVLPICPPGMLQTPAGLPMTEGQFKQQEIAGREEYPFHVAWDGILADDADHPMDIERRLREVIGVIWKRDQAEGVEHQACEELGMPSLREYFRRPSGFFADHLRHYSRSRRQAPIYWPLSTASGSYTLWIYYHRLNDDSLYTALNKYVKPKIDDTEKRLRQIESELPNATGREASSLRTAFEEMKVFLNELQELRQEIARVADLPYKPNLNDGVLITASPLWKLFRLPKWRKELQECWKKLEAGDYDWAHLAYSIWPDRVRDVCKSDRSIAIAHDLESSCELAAKPSKKKRSKKIAVEETVPGDEE